MSGIQMTGMSSGMDWGEIIDQMMEIEARPIQRYEDRIEETEELQDAYRDLNNRTASLQSRAADLTDPSNFEPLDISNTHEDVLDATVVNENQATPGTHEVFVEELADTAQVRSGAFVQNKKMAGDHNGADITSRSDFLVSEDGPLDTGSSEFLEQLRYEVQTTGEGNADIDIRQHAHSDEAEDEYGISIDLDSVDDFDHLMELVNDPTIDLDDDAALVEYTGGAADRSEMDNPEDHWGMELQYHSSNDRFTLHPGKSSDDTTGGRNFQLRDKEDDGFFQRVGFNLGTGYHYFTDSQRDHGENLLSLDSTAPLAETATGRPIKADGEIQINNTTVEWDDQDSLSDVIARMDSEVEGVNVSYNEATDRVTLEAEEPGAGDIEVEDVDGNLADVLHLREEGEDSGHVYPGEYEAGSDAEATINGDTVTASGNTIEFNGIELDLQELHTSEDHAPDNPVEVEVFEDVDEVVGMVSDFVEQYNSIISFINERNQVDVPDAPGADEEERDSGIFIGESTPRNLRTQMATMITGRYADATGSEGGIEALGDVGIEQVDPRTASESDQGMLQFNASEFREVFQDNPEAVQDLFMADESTGDEQDGVMTRLDNYLEGMTDSQDGIFQARDEGFNNRIDNLQDRIDSRMDYVENRQQTLERQFIHMESMMADLNAQQDSLAQHGM